MIEPVRSTQRLIDRGPYVTRLYSTLSADEMTADPVFVFNAELPDVNNLHQAERVIECDRDTYQSDALWRIELPRGGVIRGAPVGVGQWPDAVAEQPANWQVLTLAQTGQGQVVADNSAIIEGQLASYNEAFPRSASGPPSPASSAGSGGGLCTLGAPGAAGSRPPPAAVMAAFGGLIALAWRRRRRA